MQVLNLVVRAMTWVALGYLLRERIADRERLRAVQLAAASPPPLPPAAIALPALPPPDHEVPEAVEATEERVHAPAPSAAPMPLAMRFSTARNVLAVLVTGAAMGALAVWMLSVLPSLP